MPDGTEVESPWGYGAGELLCAAEKALLSRVGTIWALDRAGGLTHRLGTVVRTAHATDSRGRHLAFFATCYHVVEDALRVLNPRAYANLSNPFSHDLTALLKPHLRRHEIQVTLHDNPSPQAFPVKALSVSRHADLCLLQVQRPPSRPDEDILAVNSDPLEVGTIVMMAGFPKLPGEENGTALSPSNTFTAYSALQLRLGRVTAVCDQLPHRQVFGYEVDAPIASAMSGSPVFGFDGNGFAPFEAVGFCMLDSNRGEQIGVAGSGLVIGAQNLYSVLDPDAWRINAFFGQNRKPNAKPPFGATFRDVGKRKGGLVIQFEEHNEAHRFAVRRGRTARVRSFAPLVVDPPTGEAVADGVDRGLSPDVPIMIPAVCQAAQCRHLRPVHLIQTDIPSLLLEVPDSLVGTVCPKCGGAGKILEGFYGRAGAQIAALHPEYPPG
jgi:Trypsin-like peptidase domain